MEGKGMKLIIGLISSLILFFPALTTTNQPIQNFNPNQWGIKNSGTFTDEFNTAAVANFDMNVTKAWDKFSGGKEVIVAVIDTGIDYTHEDLKDTMWNNQGEIPGDGIDNDNNRFIDDIYGWNFSDNTNITYSNNDYDEHGTHVAGIIAASQNNLGISGVASNIDIKIMSLKTLSTNNASTTIDTITKAIQYAEKMGADIVNISAGSFWDDPDLKLTIENSNMLFVVGAGNGYWQTNGTNNDIIPIYPASYDSENIISVANISYDGTLNLTSNYGLKSVDIAAPGTSILSTLPNNQYGYRTGTSMAAPMVTGVLAMIYSYYEDITLVDAKNILLDSVKKIPGLEGKVATGGIPDAFKALSYNREKITSLR